MKAQQEREREREGEREKRELEHFSNKALFSNISLIGPIYNRPVLAIYADSFTMKRNTMKFRNKMKLLFMANLTLHQRIVQYSEGKIVTYNFYLKFLQVLANNTML